jgi:hypothetical protein
MAGRFQDFEAHSWEIKPVAILHCHKWVFRLGVGTEVNRGATAVSQFQMAGDEVGVKMGQEYVPDVEAKVRGIFQVLWISRCGSTMTAVELASSPSI